MNRVTVWGCVLLHMWVVVIISWELLREHPPTNRSMGVQNILGWNLMLALLICAFLTPNCLLTALPTGPNCILWAKTKICLASFYWNLTWTACCWCCSKFSSFCFILMLYSTGVWDLGSLDDTSIGNYVQFYIKGLNHLCSILIHRGVLCVKDLGGSCTSYGIWGTRMLIKYKCLPLSSVLAWIQLASTQCSCRWGLWATCTHITALSVTQDYHLLWRRDLGLLPSSKDQGCISGTLRCPPAGLLQLWKLTRPFGWMETRSTTSFSNLNRSRLGDACSWVNTFKFEGHFCTQLL